MGSKTQSLWISAGPPDLPSRNDRKKAALERSALCSLVARDRVEISRHDTFTVAFIRMDVAAISVPAGLLHLDLYCVRVTGLHQN